MPPRPSRQTRETSTGWISTWISSPCVRFRQRIEGTGDRNGQWSFANAIPAHLDSSTCKPWLTELPEILSERVDLAGGIPEAGSCTVAILDVDDTLYSTSEFATQARRAAVEVREVGSYPVGPEYRS